MSAKKLSPIEIIRQKLAEQEKLRGEIEEARKAAVQEVGKLQESIVAQEKVVAETKAKYDLENKALAELKSMLALVSGKPERKGGAVMKGGAVKEQFKEWATSAGQFTVSELIDAGITPSGGYARILVTSGIADGWLEEVADSKPKAYRYTG